VQASVLARALAARERAERASEHAMCVLDAARRRMAAVNARVNDILAESAERVARSQDNLAAARKNDQRSS